MLEFRKNATDKNKAFKPLLTELSKALDCLCHNLLIAKLHTYGLDISSLNLLLDYLLNREQRSKVDSFFSSWEDIFSGVPQGSILGSLLLNIYTRYMFLKLKTVYFTGYADDNISFAVTDNIKDVMKYLEMIANEA